MSIQDKVTKMFDKFRVETTQTLNSLAGTYNQAQAAAWLAAGLQPLIDRVEAQLPELEKQAEAAKAAADRVEAETRAGRQSADGETRITADRRNTAAAQTAHTARQHLRDAQNRLTELQAAQQSLEQAAVLPDVSEALAGLDLQIITR